jgi:hypothetical protein
MGLVFKVNSIQMCTILQNFNTNGSLATGRIDGYGNLFQSSVVCGTYMYTILEGDPQWVDH